MIARLKQWPCGLKAAFSDFRLIADRLRSTHSRSSPREIPITSATAQSGPFTVGPLLGAESRKAFFEIGLISTTHYFLKQPVKFIREADPAGPARPGLIRQPVR